MSDSLGASLRPLGRRRRRGATLTGESQEVAPSLGVLLSGCDDGVWASRVEWTSTERQRGSEETLRSLS